MPTTVNICQSLKKKIISERSGFSPLKKKTHTLPFYQKINRSKDVKSCHILKDQQRKGFGSHPLQFMMSVKYFLELI